MKLRHAWGTWFLACYQTKEKNPLLAAGFLVRQLETKDGYLLSEELDCPP